MANVTIYTRPRCIWCMLAKRLLRKNGISYDERSARDQAVRDALFARTGQRTVPQVFFDDAAVGGYQDLRARLAR